MTIVRPSHTNDFRSLPFNGGYTVIDRMLNGKIPRLVPDYAASIPYSRGAEEILAWYSAEATRRVVNPDLMRCATA